ncbi:MAG: PEP-CTERM sorting domain-containing protein [Lamprocystis purpurea]|jgi:hypothetical protein|uniref:PEP-CTERM sorting domain-containing protein n=1 Tax=Lamprocystis purpurea TaxID=61598 RepID=UPI0003AABD36|nr:PEP-CTERM sorting domain-containing protein [Lamprocystis purpurea]MBV5272617.1 PEP-CTERM sorting domain-containing protein [Lamprocystis purpurea]
MKANGKTSVIALSLLMGPPISAGASVVDILTRDFEDGLMGASAISTPAFNTWVNIRPSTDASNGASGLATFDRFFSSSFMMVGDFEGNISQSNAGTSTVSFALNLPSDLTSLTIGYNWVFDTNNPSNPSSDLFSVEFLAGSTVYDYLQGSATSLTPNRSGVVSTTRGTFSLTLTGTALSDLLTAGADQIRFRLREDNALNSSAVGIDNILITGLVPAPVTLALLGIGLAGSVVSRRKARR